MGSKTSQNNPKGNLCWIGLLTSSFVSLRTQMLCLRGKKNTQIHFDFQLINALKFKCISCPAWEQWKGRVMPFREQTKTWSCLGRWLLASVLHSSIILLISWLIHCNRLSTPVSAFFCTLSSAELYKKFSFYQIILYP